MEKGNEIHWISIKLQSPPAHKKVLISHAELGVDVDIFTNSIGDPNRLEWRSLSSDYQGGVTHFAILPNGSPVEKCPTCDQII